VKKVYSSKKKYRKLLKEQVTELSSLQRLSATSTKKAPWYIVPADDKKNSRLIISQIILDTFKSLNVHYPETSEKRRQELESIRKQL